MSSAQWSPRQRLVHDSCEHSRDASATTPDATQFTLQVELDGAQYANLSLPFSIGQLCWIEAILVGGAEFYRNSETDTSKRCAPSRHSTTPWISNVLLHNAVLASTTGADTRWAASRVCALGPL